MIYIVLTNLFGDRYFGAYSTLKKARAGIQNYFADLPFLLEDKGNYMYAATNTITNNTYYVAITYDEIDAGVNEI